MPNTRHAVICSWCNQRLEPMTPRFRLIETQTSRLTTSVTAGSFHPDCGEALLDHLMERLPAAA